MCIAYSIPFTNILEKMTKDLVEILHEAKQPIPPELSVLGGMLLPWKWR